jgi:pimeloyl-ACP methyl ester carboxylesterase
VAEPARQVTLKLALAAGGLLLAGFVAFIAVRSYRAELSDGPREPPGTPPSPEIRELVLGTTAAWFVPSRNGASILYIHGAGASRNQRWPEASSAVAAGYGVLLIDLPEFGRAADGSEWVANAKRAIKTGVDFLSAQPGLRHVGALGFSAGCAPLLQAVADDPRVEATVLLSPYANAKEHLDYEYRKWGIIAQWPAEQGARRAGYPLEQLDSRKAAARLAGRPLLIVAGDKDIIIPSRMSESLYRAATDPKRLWLVEGAGHGEYARVLADGYYAGLRDFFNQALLGKPR